jgi:hypothetical protein
LAAQDKPGHDGIGHVGSGEAVVDPRLAAWIGLLVVVQNIFTSLRDSHLFDFDEGWLYVLGLGIAGGMMLGGKEIASRVPFADRHGADAPAQDVDVKPARRLHQTKGGYYRLQRQ